MANRNKRRRIYSPADGEDEQNNNRYPQRKKQMNKRRDIKAEKSRGMASNCEEMKERDSVDEESTDLDRDEEEDEDYTKEDEQNIRHSLRQRRIKRSSHSSQNGYGSQHDARRRSERQLFKQLAAEDRSVSRMALMELKKLGDSLSPSPSKQEKGIINQNGSQSRLSTRNGQKQQMMNGKVGKIGKKRLEEAEENGDDAGGKGSSSADSSDEEDGQQVDDEDEIEEDAARTDVGEETDTFNGGRRYPVRSKRSQQFQRPQPRRSHRKRRERFGAAALQLQRLPPNPVLDARRIGHGHSRRHKLDHGSSSSSGDSSTSSDERGIHTLRNDLRQEEKFERRKLKSLLKGRKELMPINITKKEEESSLLNIVRDRVHHQNTRSSCADIDPMSVDHTIGFDQIGGLGCHIQQLKEMCLFPMLYPHIFQHFSIQPPKGVLFYGPPGTGKTLIARALANECGRAAAGGEGQMQQQEQRHRVAFFMRKGADCLSKWVGESERQLRLLFDQAYKMRPSIIFFDEIDGLAPVRSSRQDQIHSSIVSTLLALMDGIDSRGEVIVIGATNRLDSIDPALRRPGRFDRELRFDLPDAIARKQILTIHTRNWPNENHPQPEMLDWLADRTSGYCGADLKALCAEAVLIAMRKRYPHMYLSAEKLLLKPNQICVEQNDFEAALRLIVPASRREGTLFTSTHSNKHSMAKLIEPVVNKLMASRVPIGYQRRNGDLDLDNTGGTNDEPNNNRELERVVMSLKPKPAVPAARILIHGSGCLGQGTHFLPTLIARLDHLPVFIISCERVFSGGIGGPPEEQIAQTIRHALRATGQGSPVLLAMPDMDLLENTLPMASWKMLISSLNAFTGSTSVLILAAVQSNYDELSADLRKTFRPHHVYEVSLPKRKAVRAYFDAIMEAAKEQPDQFRAENYPAPPKAPLDDPRPVRQIGKKEYKELEKVYQQMLRQFRIFLRDLLRQLIRDPRFKSFQLPVDPKDVVDYYEIVKNPMCLSQMMANIDTCKYDNVEAFMNDLRLIRDNAIAYNPDSELEDITIKHTGKWLVEMAEALIDKEMDDDFPQKLEEAHLLVEEGKRSLNINSSNNSGGGEQQQTAKKSVNFVPDKQNDLVVVEISQQADQEEEIVQDEAGSSCSSGSNLKKRTCSIETVLAATIVPGKRGRLPNNRNSSTKAKERSKPGHSREEEGMMEMDKGERAESSPPPIFILDEIALSAVMEKAADKARTSSWTVPDIECLGAELELIICQYRHQWDRSGLPEQLCQFIDTFQL